MEGACLIFVSAPPLTTCSRYRVTQGAKNVKRVTFNTTLTDQCVKSDRWGEWVTVKRKIFYTAEINVVAMNKYIIWFNKIQIPL